MIHQRMIVCESISCFIRQTSMGDIINIRYTRHDETQQTFSLSYFSNAALQSFLLLILMRFLSLSMVVVGGTHVGFFSSSFEVFFSLQSTSERECAIDDETERE